MSKSPKIQKPISTRESLSGTIKAIRNIMRKDKGLNGDLDRLPMLTWLMFLKFLDDSDELHRVSDELAGRPHVALIDEPYRWRDWAANQEGLTGPELISFINQDEVMRPDGTRGPGLFAYLKTRSGGRGDVLANVFRELQNRMSSGYLLRDVVNKISEISFGSSESIHTLSHLYESMLKEMRDAAGDSGEFYTPRPVVKFMIQVLDPKLGEKVLDPACGTGGFLVEAYEHMKEQAIRAEHFRVLQEESLFGNEAKSLPYLLAQMNLVLHGIESPNITVGNSLAIKLTEIGDADRVDVIATNPPFGGEEERSIQDGFPADKRTSETALLFLQLIMRRLRRQPHAGRAAVVVPESVMGDKGVAAAIRGELVREFNLHTVVRLPKGVFEPYSDIQSNLLFFDRTRPTSAVWFVQHSVPEHRQKMKNPCYTRTMPLLFEELEGLLEWWDDRSENLHSWKVPIEEIESNNFSLDFRNPNQPSRETGDLREYLGGIGQDVIKLSRQVENLIDLELPDAEVPDLGWKRVELGQILVQTRETATVIDKDRYKQITVKLYGNGAVLRGILNGSEIRTRPQFVARKGQLIMSRIDARNGAFAVVPNDLEGALVTQDFPLFSICEELLLKEYLPILLQSQDFIDICQRASKGTTNRKRLKEALLLTEEVLVPPLVVQEAICDFHRLVSECELTLGGVGDQLSRAKQVLTNLTGHRHQAIPSNPEMPS